MGEIQSKYEDLRQTLAQTELQLRDLRLSMEAQKEQEKKKSKDSVKYLKEKKYFEEKLVVKDEEISMWKTSYNQAQKELAIMKTSLEGLCSENYFFLYIIFVLLFVIASLV